MELVTVFVIGLFVGWLIEWAIDWRFWRRAQKEQQEYSHEQWRMMTEELGQANAQINALQAVRSHHSEMREMLASAKAELTGLQKKQQHDEALQMKLANADDQISNLQMELRTMSSRMSEILARPPEQLTKIKGIGRVFAYRLNQADIHTFADLAQLTPERVEEIVSVGSLPYINPENWLVQARQLATVEPEGNQLGKIHGIGTVFMHRLNKAGIHTFAELAELTSERVMAIIGVSSLPNIKAANWIAQAHELAKDGESEGERT